MKSFSVSKSSLEQDLIEKLEPVLKEIGYECRDVEVFSGGNSLIRVTIDNFPSADGKRIHVSIEDCSKAHRIVGPMFDVWDPLPGAYSLEMSSPGEHPPLRVLSHFQEALGGNLRFQTTEPIEVPAPAKPRRKWEGLLESIRPEAETILLKDFQGTHEIPVRLVRNAVWLREWTVQDSKDRDQEKKL